MGKRNKIDNFYRYNTSYKPTELAPDKQCHREALKPFLGHLVTVTGRVVYNQDLEYCRVHDCTVTTSTDTVHIPYIWTKPLKFVSAAVEDRHYCTFTARVRIYHKTGSDTVKYGLLPIKIQEV